VFAALALANILHLLPSPFCLAATTAANPTLAQVAVCNNCTCSLGLAAFNQLTAVSKQKGGEHSFLYIVTLCPQQVHRERRACRRALILSSV